MLTGIWVVGSSTTNTYGNKGLYYSTDGNWLKNITREF